MTENIKNTETRATQLTALLEFANLNGFEGNTDKLEKVLGQWTAPRERKTSNQPSKVALENAARAEEIYAMMPEGEAVTNAWVTKNFSYIEFTNKAAVLMGILVNQGRVSKQKVGKVMTYTKL